MDCAAMSDENALNYYRCQRLNCNSFNSSLDAQGCVFHIGLIQSWPVLRKQASDTAIAVAITSLDYHRVTTS